MSFPRLKMTGDLTNKQIQEISLVYDTDAPAGAVTKLIRSKFSVTREVIPFNVSQGTKNRNPEIPYDHVRMRRTWVGYADVLTSSVSPGVYADTTTMTLLETATTYYNVYGIEFNVFQPSSRGAGLPSLSGTMKIGEQQGKTWYYGITDGEYDQTISWIVKNIEITDNQNNTSRVTFIFEEITPFEDLSAQIAAAAAAGGE